MPGTLSTELRVSFERMRDARAKAQRARRRAGRHTRCLFLPATFAVGMPEGIVRRAEELAAALKAWDEAGAELEEAALALLSMLRLE